MREPDLCNVLCVPGGHPGLYILGKKGIECLCSLSIDKIGRVWYNGISASHIHARAGNHTTKTSLCQ